MRRFQIVVSLALALSAAPVPAGAQRLVAGIAPVGGGPTVTLSFNLGTGVVEWAKPEQSDWPVVTSDGRFFLYRSFDTSGARRLVIRDARTGNAQQILDLDLQLRTAHPTKLAVYGLRGVHSIAGPLAGGLVRLDPSGLHTGHACPPGQTADIDLSADGTLLAARCLLEPHQIVLLDAGTGETLHTLPPQNIVDMRLTHDGTRLLVIRLLGNRRRDVALVEVATGATIAATTMGADGTDCQIVGIAPDRTKAVVGCTGPEPPNSIGSDVRVLDVDTLTPGPTLTTLLPSWAVFSPDNRELFLGVRHRLGPGWLQRYDLASGALKQSWGDIMIWQFAVSFPPLAPALSATVTGRRVDLEWSAAVYSPAALHHVLEIGSAAGLTDIGTIAIGAGSSLVVPEAPPGRYHLRVRAVNAVGPGDPSNDVVVDVP